MYEAKLKQYDSELNRIEDKLINIDEIDKDFYVTAEYILQLAKNSSELFKPFRIRRKKGSYQYRTSEPYLGWCKSLLLLPRTVQSSSRNE